VSRIDKDGVFTQEEMNSQKYFFSKAAGSLPAGTIISTTSQEEADTLAAAMNQAWKEEDPPDGK